uniref:Reverse transcriptase N-terminal domain-containing protein n=1 Tax=Gracilariopsis longissima TaxID=172976 RepID=A0A345U9H6_9FLOR|nr:hypothetical protein [Gracilariopsis longissima]AXI97112.1 hypothetical protein [Gracilariopsis longissima]UAD89028.1 hypothetical protein [Gracilariopsis longissima]
MVNYILNQKTQWKNLPWSQIKQRVFVLQNKIYLASQTCNKNSVYQAQNHLMNSNEAKLIAIQQVFDSIKKSYINLNQENYLIKDIHKIYILNSLFKTKCLCKSYKFLQALLEKVKQYLIYLCLGSEWNARFKSTFEVSIYHHISYGLQEKNVISCYKNCILNANNFIYTNYIDSKYINISYLKQKIESLPYFVSNIIEWLQVQNLQETEILHTSSLLLSDYLLSNHMLYQLLCKIFLHGINWLNLKSLFIVKNTYIIPKQYILFKSIVNWGESYNFYNKYYVMSEVLLDNLQIVSKSTKTYINIFMNINKLNMHVNYPLIIYHHNWILKNSHKLLINRIHWKFTNNRHIYNDLIYSCKILLYKKNSLKYLRVNNHITIHEFLRIIIKRFEIFYKLYNILLSFDIIQKFYRIISIILYFWLKKRGKKSIKVFHYWNYRIFIDHMIRIKIHLLHKICFEKINR